MKSKKLILFFLTVFALSSSISAQYTDDKSFIGSWIERENGVFERVKSLPDHQAGFTITKKETLTRVTTCPDGKLCTLEGSWFSLSMDNFAIQYDNEALGKEVVERFQYGTDKNTIERWSREEFELIQNSPFVGIWKLRTQTGEKVIYEKCEAVPPTGLAFQANADGTGKIYKLTNDNQRLEIEVSWWVGEEEGYMDMQYFNKSTDFITIEGFTLVKSSNKPTIERTRLDEFKE